MPVEKPPSSTSPVLQTLKSNMKLLTVSILLLMLAACADPARNVYEGIQLNKDIQQSPQERAMKPTPSYDQYKRESEAQ